MIRSMIAVDNRIIYAPIPMKCSPVHCVAPSCLMNMYIPNLRKVNGRCVDRNEVEADRHVLQFHVHTALGCLAICPKQKIITGVRGLGSVGAIRFKGTGLVGDVCQISNVHRWPEQCPAKTQ